MAGHEVFELGGLVLRCGVTLPDAKLAYKAYGELSPQRDNAVLMPTFFGGQHTDTELMMAPGRALDPGELFIVVPNLLGNGLSSSPSNTAPPFDGPSSTPEAPACDLSVDRSGDPDQRRSTHNPTACAAAAMRAGSSLGRASAGFCFAPWLLHKAVSEKLPPDRGQSGWV